VTLDGSASTGDPPLTCTWTLETQGGTVLDTKTGCEADYTFQNSGTQYMRLTVTDVDGDKDSSRKAISVASSALTPQVEQPAAPMASVAAGPAVAAIWRAPNPRAGRPVTLDGTRSQGAPPLTCTWTFESNDASRLGAPRNGCKVSHRFRTVGVVYVTLTVGAADGSSASSRHPVRVRALDRRYAAGAGAHHLTRLAPARRLLREFGR
jgi:hypothetical protein